MNLKRKFALVLPLIIYAALYIFVFAVLENGESDHYFTPSLEIDHQIPFIPCFVVPYVLWFLWVPVVCAFLLFEDEDLFVRTRRLLIIGMTVFLAVSAVFPTKLNLRPASIPDEGFFYMLLNMIYSADTSTNVFPSIHVYNTLVVWHAVYICDTGIFGKKWFRICASVMSILIILSTMFIKQHSVIDVAGGIVMFIVVFYIVRIFFEGGLTDPGNKSGGLIKGGQGQ